MAASSAPDWSSLPPELTSRIAGCFLATNDVDHYMDFRAVCSSWRSATDDPKNSSDVRFFPRLWVIVDEVFQGDARLLVNTATGRAVRKDLPLLRRHYYVIATTTPGASIVVADREHPNTLSLLNPFTGGLVRFAAPMPSETDITAAVHFGSSSSSSPTLFLFSDTSLYETDPECESHTVFDDEDEVEYHMIRLAVKGGMMRSGGGGGEQQLGSAAEEPPLISFPEDKILDLMQRHDVDPALMCLDTDYRSQMTLHLLHLPAMGNDNRCYLVESDGEDLIILKLQDCMKVFKIDDDVIEPVESIGNSRAIFIGSRRCLSVRADKFPTINADCIYYAKTFPEHASMEIYEYDLREKKEEKISEAIHSLLPNVEEKISGAVNSLLQASWPIDSSLQPISPSSLFVRPPFTIIQLLCSYTSNVRESQRTEKSWTMLV